MLLYSSWSVYNMYRNGRTKLASCRPLCLSYLQRMNFFRLSFARWMPFRAVSCHFTLCSVVVSAASDLGLPILL